MSSTTLKDTLLYGQDLESLSLPLQTTERTLHEHVRTLPANIVTQGCA